MLYVCCGLFLFEIIICYLSGILCLCALCKRKPDMGDTTIDILSHTITVSFTLLIY